MLITDTGPLVAALNRGDPHHEPAVRLLTDAARWPIAVPAPVVTETALFALRRLGLEAHERFLDSVGAGEVEVLDLSQEDHRRVAALCRAYRELPLDQVDASVIALAERYDQGAVATLDRRHFTIVRPRHREYLELLPG